MRVNVDAKLNKNITAMWDIITAALSFEQKELIALMALHRYINRLLKFEVLSAK